MALKNLSNPKSVLKALELYDKAGRDRFLVDHNFAKAKHYFIHHNGKLYDSKAVAAVAHGIEFPNKGLLHARDFRGGENTVRKKLQELGFEVRYRNKSSQWKDDGALILVENEATVGGKYDNWEDVTGERYHFPNQYRKKILPGKLFIYYCGTRRRDGSRKIPEYFGYGRIGNIWFDPSIDQHRAPKQSWKWLCTIDEYVRFQKPVPFKQDGRTIEDIPKNHWGVGVRSIDWDTYDQILKLAGINVDTLRHTPREHLLSLPNISDVNAVLVEQGELLLARVRVRRRVPSDASNLEPRTRRSRYAKMIGDRAEEVVYQYLKRQLPANSAKSLRWISKEGKTPGWDIEYSKSGKRVCVEVKGTSGSRFPNVEITAQEWVAAKAHRRNYWLYLVVNCLSTEPVIQAIQDPYGSFENGQFAISPLLWRLELIGGGTDL